MASVYLNRLQLFALSKIGEVICPANPVENLPSFRELGVIEHIDIVLAEIPEADLGDLKILLSLLGLLPEFIIRGLIVFLEKYRHLNGEAGTLIRTVRFGLRGLIFSLYYSGLRAEKSTVGADPVSLIGYKTVNINSAK